MNHDINWRNPPKPFAKGQPVWCPFIGKGHVYLVQDNEVEVHFHTVRADYKSAVFKDTGKMQSKDPGRLLFHAGEAVVPKRIPSSKPKKPRPPKGTPHGSQIPMEQA